MCDDALIFKTLFTGSYIREDVSILWRPQARALPKALQEEIQRHWDSLSGRHLFNGQLARLDHWAATPVNCQFVLRPSDYRTLMYSNRHVQHIRDSWGFGCLSRALGISAVVVSSDEQLILMKRSATVGEFPGCYDVFGGHIDVPENGAPPCVFTAMMQELEEEAGLTPPQCDILMIGLIEATPNKKPELVFQARAHLPAAEIIARAEKAKDNIEFSKIYTILNNQQSIRAFLTAHRNSFSPSAFGSLCVYMQTNFKQQDREGK